MDEQRIQRMPFRRSPERRSSEDSWDIDRRNNDRRTSSIGWLPLFRDVDENAINEALADCEVLLLPAGTPLLKPGEANHNVYILLSGEIAIHLDFNSSPGTAITISAGECIGEISAIDGKPVTALVLAHTDARILKLSREVFWDRLMALPCVSRNLMITLTERMRRANVQALKAQREQLELSHIRKELDVARQLQASMMPLQTPLFPERIDIEVCGFMEPAADVGGDFFDAFFVDENHLFFCIGDVSGHGIAAALFMARTIGLLHILAMNDMQPDKLLENLNDRLCVGNDTNIFVTMFCGLLDTRNGKLLYSNGGHCAPILSVGGETTQLAIPRGVLIGAFPDMKYSSMEYVLNPADILFCYTDGVTEAQNPTGEEFTEDRCLKIFSKDVSLPLSNLLDSVRREVAGFTGLELLDDDCTMLAIRRP